MPIINIKFIENVVATPEQKRELIVKMTDTFVGVLGDVVRPFTYVVIDEAKVGDWGIAGKPMPDLAYLVSEEHATVIEKSNAIMRAAIAQMANGNGNGGGGQMTGEQAKALFYRWFEEVWNKGNYNAAYEVIDPDFSVHGAGGQQIRQGPEGVIDLVKTWRNAFPNGRMVVEDVIAQGDLVYVRMHWVGTHLGDFYGVKPTGKTVKVTSIGLDRIKNGKVAEGWGELDMVGMMQHLEALPRFGSGAVASGRPADWGPSSAPTVGAGATSANGDHRGLAMRFAEAANRGDRQALLGMTSAATYVEHNPVWGPTDFESSIRLAETLRSAMPDLSFVLEPHLTVAEGELVGVHGMFQGTHTGAPLLGVPATGRRVSWTHSEILRVVGGTVVERWVSADTMTLAQQVGAIPGGAAAESSESDRNKAAVVRLYSEINKGNYAIIDELLAPDFTSYGGETFGVIRGRDGLKQVLENVSQAISNLQFSVDDVFAEGDKVVARGTVTGVHTGNFMGMAPATGKAVRWTGIAMYRFKDGQAVERWFNDDDISLMQQITTPAQNGTAPGEDKQERNRVLIRRSYKDILEAASVEDALRGVDEIFAPHYRNHGPFPREELAPDRDSLKRLIGSMKNAFADVQATINLLLADGDYVAHYSSFRARHVGEFFGVPPSGKEVVWTESHMSRIENNQVVEHWGHIDELYLLQQMGAIPQQAQARDAAATGGR